MKKMEMENIGLIIIKEIIKGSLGIISLMAMESLYIVMGIIIKDSLWII